MAFFFFFFLDLSPKAKGTRAKVNNRDLIKLKCFLHSKENHRQNERQHAKQENIFANNMTNKGLVPKTIEIAHTT